jgi:hypothetical protein
VPLEIEAWVRTPGQLIHFIANGQGSRSQGHGSGAGLVLNDTTEREERDAMRGGEIYDYARQLFEARGGQAVVEAAQRAVNFELQGESEKAETWRHIEAAMKLMRGPNQS